jgi:hypothetical protein
MSGKTLKTGIKGRGQYLKGWSTQQPGARQRTIMKHKCGKKCFLGPNKSFPICTKNTCKINRKGVYAAYIRAREHNTISNKNKNIKTRKYSRIASKAKRLLNK